MRKKAELVQFETSSFYEVKTREHSENEIFPELVNRFEKVLEKYFTFGMDTV